MFYIYHSNKLDLLKELIAYIIDNDKLEDPFASEIILVQSPGISQWLQIELAEKMGIAANIQFPLPATFIWDMFTRILPGIPKESAFSKAAMTWKLMSLLPLRLDEPCFSPLLHYLQDDSDKRKLHQLCGRIADLFDQYLVYRPLWLESWQYNKLIDGLSDNQLWQQTLWRDLQNYTQELEQSEWHRANLYQQFIKALNENNSLVNKLPKRVFVCGISSLPPVYLEALRALGQHVDIHLMFTNPCKFYWGDIQDPVLLRRFIARQPKQYWNKQPNEWFKNPETAEVLFDFEAQGEQNIGNPLLASWGRLGRDNLYFLTQIEEATDYQVFSELEVDNLLSSIQSDILNLEDGSQLGETSDEFATSSKKRILSLDDDSITFHSCHSPQREVEVLHDKLLQLLQDDPELTIRDIIIMVADIDNYTPYIQAVFGNATGESYLPYAISDRKARQAHPILQAVITLLDLPQSRFTSEQVLNLLEVKAIADRFSIQEDQLSLLRRWVKESGIRWGLDDENISSFSLPIFGQNTWRFGLDRMMLGYAMNSDEGVWQGILPYDESSGLVAELSGHLAEFLEQLNLWHQKLNSLNTLSEWRSVCQELLDCFFIKDNETEPVLTVVLQQWQSILEQGIKANYQEEIPLTLIRDELSIRFDDEKISQRFLAGSINFCTLMPMRSIPFKVVCLLGMNDGVYPRNIAPLGFDLMVEKRQRGDRKRRDDDRYLFLEALESAEKCFYISYIGRSIRDDKICNPSVLVNELMDYISQNFCLESDLHKDVDTSAKAIKQHLLYCHSRAPFSAENFVLGQVNQSFAKEWLAAAQGIGKAYDKFTVAVENESIKDILFDDLLRFYRHPIRAFFQRRLKVHFEIEDIELPEDEPFNVDNLQRYRFNSLLLDALIDGQSQQQVFYHLKAAGELPAAAFAEIYWQKQLRDMQKLADVVRQQRSDSDYIQINCSISNYHLIGQLKDVQMDGLLRWRPANLNARDGIRLWVEHLIYCMLNKDSETGESRMYGRDATSWIFLPVEPKKAEVYLQDLINGYEQGMNAPLPLFLNSGWAWVSAVITKETGEISDDEDVLRKGENHLLQSLNGGYLSVGEMDDNYVLRAYRQVDDALLTAIKETALHFFKPLLLHLKK